mgnify:CR=1 FL=1
MKNYYVYMATNRSGTLYTGVTTDLERRMAEHKSGQLPGFTSKYHIDTLVYFEETADIRAAISREKQLKHWKREWKLRLIEKTNPNLLDLFTEEPTVLSSLRNPSSATVEERGSVTVSVDGSRSPIESGMTEGGERSSE